MTCAGLRPTRRRAFARGRAESTDLAGQGGNDGLGVDQGRVAQVVEAVRAEDLSAGLEPDGLAEGDAVLGEQLWGHAAQGTEHGPASVDDLDLAVAAATRHVHQLNVLVASSHAENLKSLLTLLLRHGGYIEVALQQGHWNKG